MCFLPLKCNMQKGKAKNDSVVFSNNFTTIFSKQWMTKSYWGGGGGGRNHVFIIMFQYKKYNRFPGIFQYLAITAFRYVLVNLKGWKAAGIEFKIFIYHFYIDHHNCGKNRQNTLKITKVLFSFFQIRKLDSSNLTQFIYTWQPKTILK